MTYASCCILSYERPQFLATAVSTLLEHAGADLELIINDDGSTDPAVYHLLERWGREGVVSTVISNPCGHNQGVGESIRRCFAVATGEVLIKADQDLIFKPGWLDTTVGLLQDERIGAVGAFRYMVDPVDHQEMFIADHGDWHEVQDFVGSFFAVHRDVYRDVGPIETHSAAFAEDVAFKHKLQDAGYALALPREDIAVNQGFGIGPSTVVVAEGTVAEIHDGPLLARGR